MIPTDFDEALHVAHVTPRCLRMLRQGHSAGGGPVFPDHDVRRAAEAYLMNLRHQHSSGGSNGGGAALATTLLVQAAAPPQPTPPATGNDGACSMLGPFAQWCAGDLAAAPPHPSATCCPDPDEPIGAEAGNGYYYHDQNSSGTARKRDIMTTANLRVFWALGTITDAPLPPPNTGHGYADACGGLYTALLSWVRGLLLSECVAASARTAATMANAMSQCPSGTGEEARIEQPLTSAAAATAAGILCPDFLLQKHAQALVAAMQAYYPAAAAQHLQQQQQGLSSPAGVLVWAGVFDDLMGMVAEARRWAASAGAAADAARDPSRSPALAPLPSSTVPAASLPLFFRYFARALTIVADAAALYVLRVFECIDERVVSNHQGGASAAASSAANPANPTSSGSANMAVKDAMRAMGVPAALAGPHPDAFIASIVDHYVLSGQRESGFGAMVAIRRAVAAATHVASNSHNLHSDPSVAAAVAVLEQELSDLSGGMRHDQSSSSFSSSSSSSLLQLSMRAEVVRLALEVLLPRYVVWIDTDIVANPLWTARLAGALVDDTIRFYASSTPTTATSSSASCSSDPNSISSVGVMFFLVHQALPFLENASSSGSSGAAAEVGAAAVAAAAVVALCLLPHTFGLRLPTAAVQLLGHMAHKKQRRSAPDKWTTLYERLAVTVTDSSNGSGDSRVDLPAYCGQTLLGRHVQGTLLALWSPDADPPTATSSGGSALTLVSATHRPAAFFGYPQQQQDGESDDDDGGNGSSGGSSMGLRVGSYGGGAHGGDLFGADPQQQRFYMRGFLMPQTTYYYAYQAQAQQQPVVVAYSADLLAAAALAHLRRSGSNNSHHCDYNGGAAAVLFGPSPVAFFAVVAKQVRRCGRRQGAGGPVTDFCAAAAATTGTVVRELCQLAAFVPSSSSSSSYEHQQQQDFYYQQQAPSSLVLSVDQLRAAAWALHTVLLPPLVTVLQGRWARGHVPVREGMLDTLQTYLKSGFFLVLPPHSPIPCNNSNGSLSEQQQYALSVIAAEAHDPAEAPALLMLLFQHTIAPTAGGTNTTGGGDANDDGSGNGGGRADILAALVAGPDGGTDGGSGGNDYNSGGGGGDASMTAGDPSSEAGLLAAAWLAQRRSTYQLIRSIYKHSTTTTSSSSGGGAELVLGHLLAMTVQITDAAGALPTQPPQTHNAQPQDGADPLQHYYHSISAHWYDDRSASGNGNGDALWGVGVGAAEAEAMVRYAYELGEALRIDHALRAANGSSNGNGCNGNSSSDGQPPQPSSLGVALHRLLHSTLCLHPHPAVHAALFDLYERYYVMFVLFRADTVDALLRQWLLLPQGGVRAVVARVRTRVCYVFNRLCALLKSQLQPYALDVARALTAIFATQAHEEQHYYQQYQQLQRGGGPPSHLITATERRDLYEGIGVLLSAAPSNFANNSNCNQQENVAMCHALTEAITDHAAAAVRACMNNNGSSSGNADAVVADAVALLASLCKGIHSNHNSDGSGPHLPSSASASGIVAVSMDSGNGNGNGGGTYVATTTSSALSSPVVGPQAPPQTQQPPQPQPVLEQQYQQLAQAYEQQCYFLDLFLRLGGALFGLLPDDGNSNNSNNSQRLLSQFIAHRLAQQSQSSSNSNGNGSPSQASPLQEGLCALMHQVINLFIRRPRLASLAGPSDASRMGLVVREGAQQAGMQAHAAALCDMQEALMAAFVGAMVAAGDGSLPSSSSNGSGSGGGVALLVLRVLDHFGSRLHGHAARPLGDALLPPVFRAYFGPPALAAAAMTSTDSTERAAAGSCGGMLRPVAALRPVHGVVPDGVREDAAVYSALCALLTTLLSTTSSSGTSSNTNGNNGSSGNGVGLLFRNNSTLLEAFYCQNLLAGGPLVPLLGAMVSGAMVALDVPRQALQVLTRMTHWWGMGTAATGMGSATPTPHSWLRWQHFPPVLVQAGGAGGEEACGDGSVLLGLLLDPTSGGRHPPMTVRPNAAAAAAVGGFAAMLFPCVVPHVLAALASTAAHSGAVAGGPSSSSPSSPQNGTGGSSPGGGNSSQQQQQQLDGKMYLFSNEAALFLKTVALALDGTTTTNDGGDGLACLYRVLVGDESSAAAMDGGGVGVLRLLLLRQHLEDALTQVVADATAGSGGPQGVLRDLVIESQQQHHQGQTLSLARRVLDHAEGCALNPSAPSLPLPPPLLSPESAHTLCSRLQEEKQQHQQQLAKQQQQQSQQNQQQPQQQGLTATTVMGAFSASTRLKQAVRAAVAEMRQRQQHFYSTMLGPSFAALLQQL